MRILFLLSLFIPKLSMAEVGKILRVIGEPGAHLIRENKVIPLTPKLKLEKADKIVSDKATAIHIHLYPATQVSMAKNSELKLSDFQVHPGKGSDNVYSEIDFLKGIIRVLVPAFPKLVMEQKVQAEGVSFNVSDSDFEISSGDSGDVELDVFAGNVTASSPYIQSFVPEVIKTGEGFRFSKSQKAFMRRKFKPKFSQYPGASDSKKMLLEWKKTRK